MVVQYLVSVQFHFALLLLLHVSAIQPVRFVLKQVYLSSQLICHDSWKAMRQYRERGRAFVSQCSGCLCGRYRSPFAIFALVFVTFSSLSECAFVSESVCVYVCMLNGRSWDCAYHPTVCLTATGSHSWPLGGSHAVSHADVQYILLAPPLWSDSI